ncbi:MAG: sulfatase [Holophagales bacterium]|nr:sulfatase [Holophagales bacterium]MYB20851.1 sulfatase [Holophagales bacterium]MYH25491.1 sulfatase [Holophagales bacterium]MYI34457.1 sulfatase [Holophagales bacterium]
MVLWIVDTLRQDRLGVYGFDRPVSPHYDALAAESTVFDAAFAQSSWTRPTVASILTGVGPARHAVHSMNHSLAETWTTLPERLSELGYATAGFSANGNVKRELGFAQGFDEFWFSNRVTAGTMAERALAWLDELGRGQPFFLMILSVEPHDGYEPAAPFRERFAAEVADPDVGTESFMDDLRWGESKARAADSELVKDLLALYDGEVAWNDQQFGDFRRELTERGLDPAIIVVADHGEAFGEHGRFGHIDLQAEVMRVPLLIRLPGQTKGRRSGVPVSQVDLAPTLVELAGGAQALDDDGVSLVPALGDRPAGGLSSGRPILSVSMLRRGEVVPEYSLVNRGWKLVWTPDRETVELFSWRSKEGEAVNLAEDHPAIASGMLHDLRQRIEQADAVSVETELDEETRRQLKAMGYIE